MRRLFGPLLLALVLSMSFPVLSEAAQEGFQEENGRVYYYQGGNKVTGYQKIGEYFYYFGVDGAEYRGIVFADGAYRFFRTTGDAAGAAITEKGWLQTGDKKYRLSSGGVIREGFFKLSGKTYYQTVQDGIVTGTVTIEDKEYHFDENGVLDESGAGAAVGTASGAGLQTSQTSTEKDENPGIAEETGKFGETKDIIFFTKYESGSAGYAQTGGDSGNACGKYQFDRRYSLVPFLRYCLNTNEQFFSAFKKFAALDVSSASSQKILRGNQELYKAWADCYEADPKYFSSMQDKYAIEAYYKASASWLKKRGLDMDKRAYVVRGALFSYAIQEGTLVAAQAVLDAGISPYTSDEDFLSKLYDYRWTDPRGWNKESRFRSRYEREKSDAITILRNVKSKDQA